MESRTFQYIQNLPGIIQTYIDEILSAVADNLLNSIYQFRNAPGMKPLYSREPAVFTGIEQVIDGVYPELFPQKTQALSTETRNLEEFLKALGDPCTYLFQGGKITAEHPCIKLFRNRLAHPVNFGDLFLTYKIGQRDIQCQDGLCCFAVCLDFERIIIKKFKSVGYLQQGINDLLVIHRASL